MLQILENGMNVLEFPNFKFRKLTCESNDLLNKHICLLINWRLCSTVNLIRLKYHMRTMLFSQNIV